MVIQSTQQFGSDEEVLARVLGAGNFHHAGVDESVG
jgi:hypothetical protein